MELFGIIIILLLTALLLDYFYKKKWSKGLEIRIQFSKPQIIAGESLNILEKLLNFNYIFLPYIELKYEITNNGVSYDNRKEIFSLNARQKVTRTATMKNVPRGVYEINKVYVISRGLFLRNLYHYEMENSSRMIVYPRLVDVDKIFIHTQTLSGDTKSNYRQIEDPFEYRGVRSYVENDHFSKINWNATAATGQFMVNTFEDMRRLKVMIILQLPDRQTEGASQLGELDISIAASLYVAALDSNIPVSLLSNGTDVFTGELVYLSHRSDQSYKKIALESMARINTEHLIDGENDGIEIEHGTSIVVITQLESMNRDRIKQVLKLGEDGIDVLIVIVSKQTATAVKEIQKRINRYAGMSSIAFFTWWQ